MMRRIAVPILACLVLAACGREEAPVQPVDDDRSAEGEVLEGTISDAMLPLDTIQSQSPPLESGEDRTPAEE